MKRKKWYKRILLSATISILLLVVHVLFIAEPATAQEQQAEQSTTLNTITVTAQKQKENIQDVPVSITVLNTQDIEDMEVDSMQELINFSPNMHSFYSGILADYAIIVRGLSARTSITSGSTAGLFVDGVPTLGSFGYEEGMVDIERVEFLKGPQGTLYGKSTEAGAINIVTRQPDNNFRGTASIKTGGLLSSESGDRLTGGASLSVSGPIVKDRLFFGIAGKYDHQDGFIKNTYTDDSEYDLDKSFVRTKLRWLPNDDLELRLLVSYYELEQDGQNQNLSASGAASYGLPAPAYRRVSSDFSPYQNITLDSQSLTILYDLTDEMTLTSITSRKGTNLDAALDMDFSPVRMMHGTTDSDIEKLAQEVRLDRVSEKYNWLIGCYYDKDSLDAHQPVESDIPSMNFDQTLERDGNAYAFFGNVGYFLTPHIKITGGLRYEKQKMDFSCNMLPEDRSNTWEDISPKIALEYHFTPDMMAYVNAAHGYRTGGFNSQATNPEYYSYDEESLWSYEAGFKSVLMDKKLMFNLSLFYMDISDMQVMEAIGPYETYLTNAAKASSSGAEMDVRFKVTDSLTLSGGLGLTNIEFDDFKDAYGNYEGNKNPFAPDYTFNLGASYRHPVGYYARVDLIGYGKMYMDKENTNAVDAYMLVNAKIGYETERYDIYLYGKNIFDKKYDSLGYYDGVYDLYSNPGQIGLEMVYRF